MKATMNRKAKPKAGSPGAGIPPLPKRFHRLLFAWARNSMGKLRALTSLKLRSISAKPATSTHPDSRPIKYRDAILSNMSALKKAFPKSVTMIYANFMPGEWLPDPLLASVYDHAKKINVGVGGPDMIP